VGHSAEVHSETPTATRFAHDFSRTPGHAPAPITIQPKLSVNAPGDLYEQEADHVAEQVMRMPEPKLQRACACGGGCASCQTEQPGQEHQRLQTKHVGSSNAGQVAAPPIVHDVLASPGQPLDASTRAFFEPRFGHDFSNVRVHSDAAAAQSARNVNAKAYTVGNNIVVGANQFAPTTREGRRLIAHELTHVVQQQRSTVAAIQRYSDAAILADLAQNVGKDDTRAQRLRIEHLTEIFGNLDWAEANDLLKRLSAREKGDKLAKEFHDRISTQSREKLLAILEKKAATIPGMSYSGQRDPRKDPKFIDNVIDSVWCRLIYADRYGLEWQGGKMVVHNPEIDWTGTSKALPIVSIHASKNSALADAAEWQDVAKGYDTVVAYYRGDAGVILPTWISPETAPITYDLIMGVNAKVRGEAKGYYEFFRGLRNGMILGAVVGGVFRILGYGLGRFGGGGAPKGPILDEPVPGGGPPAPKTEPAPGRAPVTEPAPGSGEPVKPAVKGEPTPQPRVKGTPETGTPGNARASSQARAESEPVPQPPGPWRGKPQIQDGNLKKGWAHIEARHVTGTDPEGAGDLFAPGTTRAQLQRAAEDLGTKGNRISDPARQVQVFERRMTINGKSDNVRVVVDTADGSVITIFPVRGGG
jgi:hypothetical protein